MFKSNRQKYIVLFLLICIFMRAAICLLPFDGRIPLGGDNYGHMHQLDMIHKYGYIGWDSYWYGGMPFLKFYPPLSFSVSAFLSNFIGGIDAYNLASLLAFSLTPIAAYLLFKEFFSTTKEILFATALFSFTTYYAHALWAGWFPSTFSIPFALLFLTFFLRYVKGMRPIYLVLSSIFLALTALSHLSTLYVATMLSLIYLVAFFIDHKIEAKRILLSLCAYPMGFLLGSFWLIPTLVERGLTNFAYYFAEVPLILTPFFNILKIYGVNLNWSVILITAVAGILILYGIKNSLRKTTLNAFTMASFFVFLAGFMGLIVFFPFAQMQQTRWIILMSISTTILITKNLRSKWFSYLAVLFLVVQIIAFMTFAQQSVDMQSYVKVAEQLQGKEGRAIYVPSLDMNLEYILPKYGVEDARGYFVQGLSQTRKTLSETLDVVFFCYQKTTMSERISSMGLFSGGWAAVQLDECVWNQNASIALLQRQDVRFVIINNVRPEVISWFENRTEFRLYQKTENFTIMEMKDAKYIQTEPGIDWSYSKAPDKIDIELRTDNPIENVKVVVSEAWYPNWESKEAVITQDDLGYMVLTVPELNGSKHITLEFVKPVYQQAGEWITVISWVGLAAFVTIRRKELFHLK